MRIGNAAGHTHLPDFPLGGSPLKPPSFILQSHLAYGTTSVRTLSKREGDPMQIRFQTPHQYFFIHEEIKHLLVLWSKEQHRELYVVEEDDDALSLRYPGETYTALVLDQLEDVFFQRLETGEEQFRAALASTFYYQKRLIGAYYRVDQAESAAIDELYFFEIRDRQLFDIADEDYEPIAQQFFEKFPEYIV